MLTRLSQSGSLNPAMSRKKKKKKKLSYIARLFWERTPGRVCLLNFGTFFLIYIFIYLLFFPCRKHLFHGNTPVGHGEGLIIRITDDYCDARQGFGRRAAAFGRLCSTTTTSSSSSSSCGASRHWCDRPWHAEASGCDVNQQSTRDGAGNAAVQSECLSIRRQQSKAVFSEECVRKENNLYTFKQYMKIQIID